jgi:hypothetical protein
MTIRQLSGWLAVWLLVASSYAVAAAQEFFSPWESSYFRNGRLPDTDAVPLEPDEVPSRLPPCEGAYVPLMQAWPAALPHRPDPPPRLSYAGPPTRLPSVDPPTRLTYADPPALLPYDDTPKPLSYGHLAERLPSPSLEPAMGDGPRTAPWPHTEPAVAPSNTEFSCRFCLPSRLRGRRTPVPVAEQ